MKPDKESTSSGVEEQLQPVAGDVIGDTAYSERFVLKILLKLANLDTLKNEINEKSFEDDLCVLWDMTAERDVVLFLQRHDVLKLFNFALPVIETPRIIEIVIGIIANMCCQKEIVGVLMKMDDLLNNVIEFINTDDSLVLIQLLRLINACIYQANDEEIAYWMDSFSNIKYSTALYFILRNSSHKVLLVTAFENFNTLCSYCNTEKFRTIFFNQFVTCEALDSLIIAFSELAVNQKDLCLKDELERILVISLQVVLNLVGFDESNEIYQSSTESTLSMISIILSYYENKLVSNKEMDTDLLDVVESTSTIVNILKVNDTCEPSKYLEPTYSIWKTITSIAKSDENGSSFEDNDIEELEEFSEKIKPLLSALICNYLSRCSDENLLKVLDTIGDDFDYIVSLLNNKDLQQIVHNRTNSYRTRLKEATDRKSVV